MASLRVETRYAASWPGYDQGVQNVNDARDFSLPSELQALIRRLTAPIQPATRRLRVT